MTPTPPRGSVLTSNHHPAKEAPMTEPTYYRSVTLTFPEPARADQSSRYTVFRTRTDHILADVNLSIPIDLHDPVITLPTTSGSVVRDEDNDLWVLDADGLWHCVTNPGEDILTPAALSYSLAAVLFTAPAKQTSP